MEIEQSLARQYKPCQRSAGRAAVRRCGGRLRTRPLGGGVRIPAAVGADFALVCSIEIAGIRFEWGRGGLELSREQ